MRPAALSLDYTYLITFTEGLIGVPSRNAKLLGKSLDEVVHIPSDLVPKYGEGIVVSLDIGHELHCLVSNPTPNTQQMLMLSMTEHDTDVYI